MNKCIIEHLFEFWTDIGKSGGFYKKGSGYSYTKPMKNSWPSKLFDVEMDRIDFDGLKNGIKEGKLPNSIGQFEQEGAQSMLENNGFLLTSTVKAMAKDISEAEEFIIDESGIVPVDSDKKTVMFAAIASKAFGYEVLGTTIASIYRNQAFKLFLGTYGDSYSTCGILYCDKNGVSGIHMIGTSPEFRGLGLGRTMTQHLINEALKKGSEDVYLVASQAGERIYTKMGFTSHGVLESYSLPKKEELYQN